MQKTTQEQRDQWLQNPSQCDVSDIELTEDELTAYNNVFDEFYTSDSVMFALKVVKKLFGVLDMITVRHYIVEEEFGGRGLGVPVNPDVNDDFFNCELCNATTEHKNAITTPGKNRLLKVCHECFCNEEARMAKEYEQFNAGLSLDAPNSGGKLIFSIYMEANGLRPRKVAEYVARGQQAAMDRYFQEHHPKHRALYLYKDHHLSQHCSLYCHPLNMDWKYRAMTEKIEKIYLQRINCENTQT
jgi:hypothetical protein